VGTVEINRSLSNIVDLDPETTHQEGTPGMASIGIVYYSMSGNHFEMAKTLAQGIEAAGGKAQLRRVREQIPQGVIEEMGLTGVQEAQADVPEASVDELPEFDGLLIGSPTRYGSAAGQLQSFLDQTGPLWAEGKLVGKAAGFFTGAATMHGGHESTILGLSTFAYHQGMVIVPLGYGVAAEVGSTRTGGSPYGPTVYAPQDGSKDGLSADERAIALAYAEHFHGIADKLAA
jgi:NAD(P)H dehydrogenase (quinone)